METVCTGSACRHFFGLINANAYSQAWVELRA